jgi:Cu-processing system permease protein
MTTVDVGLDTAAVPAPDARARGAVPPARALLRIVGFELRDVARSRWLAAYAGFFLAGTELLVRFGGDAPRTLLSLVNVVLLLIPLVSVVFGTMYLYHAREFNELLLAQPVSRRVLYWGLYLGLALPLAGGFALGVGLPLLLRGVVGTADAAALAALLGSGVLLTLAFLGVAFVIALRFEDRVKGLGAALGAWLAAAVLYDAVVLLVATLLADRPIEGPLLALMLLNPVDLARVVLLLQFDVSALLGYTGAVFQRFLGSSLGIAAAAAALGAWVAGPALLGLRLFRRKDF